MPGVHMHLIHCWFPSYCRLRAVYVCDCNLYDHVSVCVYISGADKVESQL